MALKSNKTAVAVVKQPVRGTFLAPSSTTDVLPVSNVRLDIQGVTISNDEYTGTIDKNGDEISGKNVTFTYNVKLRGPGGSVVPAADAFIMGRILQAAKMTESRMATAIPASNEALGVGSTTKLAKLGTTAVATAGLYKGMSILLGTTGSYYSRLSAIRSYTAAKDAALMEELAAIPSAGYQIPAQLAYHSSIDAGDPPVLSTSIWIGATRYDLSDCVPTSLRLRAPVSTRDQGAYPEMECSFTATLSGYADQATPSIPSLGPVPKFRDGDWHIAYKAMGGTGFSVDMGLNAAYPPNPNYADGSEPAELVERMMSLETDRLVRLKSEFDAIGMADAQAYHPHWAQWGYTPGNIISVVIPDFRMDYSGVDPSGDFVTQNGRGMIDVMDRSLSIVFPY